MNLFHTEEDKNYTELTRALLEKSRQWPDNEPEAAQAVAQLRRLSTTTTDCTT